ncbi:MAG: rRNA maturation RNase YbeY [Sphingobacteriia bacterium]|nr:rRNA maturation RNase YbeY [Sphingobacteriia bacterium]
MLELSIDYISKTKISDIISGYKKLVDDIVKLTIKTSNKLKKANIIELSITICDDKYIQELNREYRNKDKPTNVLSFPAHDLLKQSVDSYIFNNYILLGDIILSVDTLKKEAREENKLIKNHFIHLMVHSTLHLLGYDHEIEEDALIMEGLEEKILALKNIPSPYKEK